MSRDEGGPGSTGTNFDMNLYGGIYATALNFTTVNAAPFVENTFHFGRLSVTPGFRFEYIKSTADGYNSDGSSPTVLDTFHISVSRTWLIPLAGCALQFKKSDFTDI